VSIHFEKLPPNSWFVVVITDESISADRRQGSQQIKNSISIEYDAAIGILKDATGMDVRKDYEKIS